MHKRLYIFLTILPLLFQCNKIDDYAAPSLFDNILSNSTPISYNQLKSLEGIYSVSDGFSPFGTEYVCLANFNTLTFISNKSGIYFVLKVGYLSTDTSVVMSGYWRFPLSSEKGNIRFSITDKSFVSKVFSNNVDSNCILPAIYNSGEDVIIKSFKIKFLRKFSENVLQSNFKVLAHRGGGRNSDELPFSENSLEMIKHAECFGADGIEIDIKLTKDKIPILYHDDDINVRLTQKSPLMGNIEKYNFNLLNDYVKLIRGESIPSLEEALNAVIDSTMLEIIWLDLKDEENIFNIINPLIEAAKNRAISKNRNIKIYAGIASDEVLEEFKLYPNYQNLPSACEISLDVSKELKSKVWAPRWTLGVQDEMIQDAHNNGIEVFIWTLDEESFIRQYIKQNKYDAILTNYSSLVAYQHYSQK